MIEDPLSPVEGKLLADQAVLELSETLPEVSHLLLSLEKLTIVNGIDEDLAYDFVAYLGIVLAIEVILSADDYPASRPPISPNPPPFTWPPSTRHPTEWPTASPTARPTQAPSTSPSFSPTISADIENWRTTILETQANSLHHGIAWDSSTGHLPDLEGARIREHVTWTAAEVVFGPSRGYDVDGEHYGQATSDATIGSGNDFHLIIPTDFIYSTNVVDGFKSEAWIMNQGYEYTKDNGRSWQAIPESRYQITRWFERRGDDLLAYCSKRGIDETDEMHRAALTVQGYFANNVTAPNEMESPTTSGSGGNSKTLHVLPIVLATSLLVVILVCFS